MAEGAGIAGKQRRPAKTGRQEMFSGLLYCADCGEKLYLCTTNSFSLKQGHYVCSNYKNNTGACTAHFVREETLKTFVRQSIFDITRTFFDDITSFQQAARKQRFEETDKAVKRRKRELEQAAVNTCEQDKADFDSFAAAIRKYVGIMELTPTIVDEFVKKVIAHVPDESSGYRRQKIQIIWNLVGELEQDEDKQTVERQRKSRTA